MHSVALCGLANFNYSVKINLINGIFEHANLKQTFQGQKSVHTETITNHFVKCMRFTKAISGFQQHFRTISISYEDYHDRTKPQSIRAFVFFGYFIKKCVQFLWNSMKQWKLEFIYTWYKQRYKTNKTIKFFSIRPISI